MANESISSKKRRVTFLVQFSQVIQVPGNGSLTGSGSTQVNLEDVPNDISLDKLSQTVQTTVDGLRQAGFQVTRVSLML
ncbi:MAG: hypothetical protein ABSH08_18250 [Tepidisphaeraceae bacterium]|jgi:hypothetical protein